MERKYTGLRVAITAALVAEAISACFPTKTSATDISPTNTAVNPRATYVAPTPLPNFRDYLPTFTPMPTSTEAPTPTIEQRFTLGHFDAAKTPFTARPGDQLYSLMDYIPAFNQTVLTADIPLPITVPEFGTIEQLVAFEKAVTDNSEGNPYYVITTDQLNHIFFYFHSITQDSVGEIARKVSSFVIQHPDKKDDILGQEVIITLGENPEVTAEIVNLNVVSADFFDNMATDSPWGVYPNGANILFARTDAFGIPDRVRNDKTPGNYYITIIACQSKDGKISLSYAKNVKQRALLTLKIQIP